jgi:hypothetical protein
MIGRQVYATDVSRAHAREQNNGKTSCDWAIIWLQNFIGWPEAYRRYQVSAGTIQSGS